MTKSSVRTNILVSAAVAGAAALIAVLGGCGSAHQDAPDPTPGNTHPGTHQVVIQMPDGFRNVAISCYGPTGIYVTSRGQTSDIITSGIALLANDPACRN